MKFERLPQFLTDWAKLSEAEQQLFRRVMREKFGPACIGYADALPATYTWPAALRVHPMKGKTKAWEMTWSFKQPSMRATFHLETEDAQVILYWRRIGDHSIYDEP